MMSAEYFATLKGKQILAVNEAYPPHELNKNQVAITKEEFFLLRALPPLYVKNLGGVRRMLLAIQRKINRIGD